MTNQPTKYTRQRFFFSWLPWKGGSTLEISPFVCMCVRLSVCTFFCQLLLTWLVYVFDSGWNIFLKTLGDIEPRLINIYESRLKTQSRTSSFFHSHNLHNKDMIVLCILKLNVGSWDLVQRFFWGTCKYLYSNEGSNAQSETSSFLQFPNPDSNDKRALSVLKLMQEAEIWQGDSSWVTLHIDTLIQIANPN